jgi:hypothetical protein
VSTFLKIGAVGFDAGTGCLLQAGRKLARQKTEKILVIDLRPWRDLAMRNDVFPCAHAGVVNGSGDRPERIR